METYARHNLYQNLPLYARTVGDEKGLLFHFFQSLQKYLDDWDRRRHLLSLIYTVDGCPREWLPWLGQWVGLGGTPEHWLGVGMNQKWPTQAMRQLVKEASSYWRHRGTHPAIRQAVRLWLLWDEAEDPRYFDLHIPFGDRPKATPDGWWGYDTPYYQSLKQNFIERQFYGGKNKPTLWRQKEKSIVNDKWTWDWGAVWHDRMMTVRKLPATPSRAHRGPRDLHMHFQLDQGNWNQISPDIHTLNPEIVPALARPLVFTWYEEQQGQVTVPRSPEADRVDTQLVWKPDGFQWNDVYPFWRKPKTTYREEIEIHNFVSTDPFQWGDRWGRPRQEFPGIPVERTIEKERGQWGAGWGYSYGRIERQEWQEITVPAFVELGADWQDPYGGGTPWQYTFESFQQIGMEWGMGYGSGEVWSGRRIGYREVRSQVVRQAIPFFTWSVARSRTVETEIVPGEPTVIEALETKQWYATPKTYAVRRRIEIPPGDPVCRPGMWASIPVGEEEVVVPAVPGAPPNLFAKPVEGSTREEVIPGLPGWMGADWLSPWNRVGKPRFAAVAELEEVPSFEVESFETDPPDTSDAYVWNLYDRPHISAPYMWGVPGTPEERRTIVERKPGIQLTYPQAIALWGSPYRNAYAWYYPGGKGTPERRETLPVYELRQMCNIINRWSLRWIDWWEEREIDPSLRSLSLAQIYPLLAAALEKKKWRLYIKTNQEFLEVLPVTLYLEGEKGDRYTSISSGDESRTIQLEFVTKIPRQEKIRDFWLFHENLGLTNFKNTYRLLHHEQESVLGFRYKISLNLPKRNVSATDTVRS